MSVIERLRGKNTSGSDNRPTLTVVTALTTYFKTKALLDFVETGRMDDVQDMEQYFTNVHAKGKYNYNRKVRNDKGGMPYQYINFLESNGSEGVKVVHLDKMAQFIRDYNQGKFWIDFTFEELVAEAEKV